MVASFVVAAFVAGLVAGFWLSARATATWPDIDTILASATPVVAVFRLNNNDAPYAVECLDCGWGRCDHTTASWADADRVRTGHQTTCPGAPQ